MKHLALAAAFAVALPTGAAAQVNADAAHALAQRNGCLKCHAVDKRKKAPSYLDIANKYRGKPDGEALLLKHITGKSTVQVAEGDVQHEPMDTKDETELRNFARWVLSR